MTLLVCLLTGVLLAVPVRADDPPKKLTPGERKELKAKSQAANAAGLKAYQAGKIDDAVRSVEEGLKIARRLFNPIEFPNGHRDLATAMNNLGFLYKAQGKLAAAEPLYKDALAMKKRLFKGDHPDVATGLNNLASLYQAQGKLADAEPLLKDALAMDKRLHKGDHPDVARSLSNLASLYGAQGRLAAAEPLHKDALAMRKRLFPGDHPDVAKSLNNLAGLYCAHGRPGRRRAALQGRPGHAKAAVPGRPPGRGHRPEQPGISVPGPGEAGRRRAALQGRPWP